MPSLSMKLIPASYVEAYQVILDNPKVTRMTMTLACPISLEMAEARRAPLDTDKASLFRMGLFDGDVLVGEVGTFENEQGNHEIGYLIGQEFWGQGYATAVVPLMIKAIRDGGYDGQIDAGVYDDNPASLRVLMKNDFAPVGKSNVYSVERRREVSGLLLRHRP